MLRGRASQDQGDERNLAQVIITKNDIISDFNEANEEFS